MCTEHDDTGSVPNSPSHRGTLPTFVKYPGNRNLHACLLPSQITTSSNLCVNRVPLASAAMRLEFPRHVSAQMIDRSARSVITAGLILSAMSYAPTTVARAASRAPKLSRVSIDTTPDARAFAKLQKMLEAEQCQTAPVSHCRWCGRSPGVILLHSEFDSSHREMGKSHSDGHGSSADLPDISGDDLCKGRHTIYHKITTGRSRPE